MNTEELTELIEQYGKLLYGFCHQLTGSKQEADDLYQDTFLKAVELSDKIQKEQNPKSFLAGIAVRIFRNKKRKEARHQKIAPKEEWKDNQESVSSLENSPEFQVLTRERTLEIRQAVKQLELRLQIPVYLYYTANMSIKEIGKIMKIPSGTVKSRLYKARKILKSQLEVDDDER